MNIRFPILIFLAADLGDVAEILGKITMKREGYFFPAAIAVFTEHRVNAALDMDHAIFMLRLALENEAFLRKPQRTAFGKIILFELLMEREDGAVDILQFIDAANENHRGISSFIVE